MIASAWTRLTLPAPSAHSAGRPPVPEGLVDPQATTTPKAFWCKDDRTPALVSEADVVFKALMCLDQKDILACGFTS